MTHLPSTPRVTCNFYRKGAFLEVCPTAAKSYRLRILQINGTKFLSITIGNHRDQRTVEPVLRPPSLWFSTYPSVEKHRRNQNVILNCWNLKQKLLRHFIKSLQRCHLSVLGNHTHNFKAENTCFVIKLKKITKSSNFLINSSSL